LDYKRARKNWIRLYRGTYKAEYNFLDPITFITKYASKIRWAKSICEIGMGQGDLLGYLYNRYPNKEYSGVDLNPDILNILNGFPDSNITIEQTGKYLKNIEGTVDAIISHCHLMYYPIDSAIKVCNLMSEKANKYILIKEILMESDYEENDYETYFKYGFGRDYSDMFEGFVLKESEVEVVNNIEYQSYLFKKI